MISEKQIISDYHYHKHFLFFTHRPSYNISLTCLFKTVEQPNDK